MADNRMTQRLVGAIVLVAVVVIFVPMVFERQEGAPKVKLPALPPPPSDVTSAIVIPLQKHAASVPPAATSSKPETGAAAGASGSAVATPSTVSQQSAGEALSTSGPPAAESTGLDASGSGSQEAPGGGSPPSPRAKAAAEPRKTPRAGVAEAKAAPHSLEVVPLPPRALGATSKKHEPSAWVIQVGTFSNAGNAMELRDRIRRSGHSAFIEVLKGAQGTLYRVRVGPELRRETAEALRGELRKDLHLDALVMRYP
jgi:DedD protein